MAAMLIFKKLIYKEANKINYFNEHYRKDTSFHTGIIYLHKKIDSYRLIQFTDTHSVW
jgi:hypothetical protein